MRLDTAGPRGTFWVTHRFSGTRGFSVKAFGLALCAEKLRPAISCCRHKVSTDLQECSPTLAFSYYYVIPLSGHGRISVKECATLARSHLISLAKS
jgi:hypothetical protein